MRHLFLLREARSPAIGAPAWGDAVALALVGAVLYGALALGTRAPAAVGGPAITLAPSALPGYAAQSLGRMAAAYALSMSFTLVYGHVAARSKTAERVLMPLLDVLQSVPILSFLPVVLLSLSAVLPVGVAVELAAVVLLFTSQAWNLTFAWYQALSTEPTELREAASTFRFSGWLRFRTLELPHAAIALVWNSMMSWAGGWFFLMAAESFTVGARDFRLPGLGSYLYAAAERGDVHAVTLGLGALVLLIVALDQLVWRPLIAWSHRFKLETVTGDEAPSSWFLEALRSSPFNMMGVWHPVVRVPHVRQGR
jgi:NitT/TauT family transport system permease protein